MVFATTRSDKRQDKTSFFQLCCLLLNAPFAACPAVPQVKIDPVPFSRGALRFVYHLKDLSADASVSYVAKMSFDPRDALDRSGMFGRRDRERDSQSERVIHP